MTNLTAHEVKKVAQSVMHRDQAQGPWGSTFTNTVVKEGVLYKQAAFFSSWEEKLLNLEGSLLKIYSTPTSPVPKYTIPLSHASVEGVFTPTDNDDAGHGHMWSFVVRWPSRNPASVEEFWASVHMGSDSEAECVEWYKALKSAQEALLLRWHLQSQVRIVKPPAEKVEIYRVLPADLQHALSLARRAWGEGRWSLVRNVEEGQISVCQSDPLLWKVQLWIDKPSAVVFENMKSGEFGCWRGGGRIYGGSSTLTPTFVLESTGEVQSDVCLLDLTPSPLLGTFRIPLQRALCQLPSPAGADLLVGIAAPYSAPSVPPSSSMKGLALDFLSWRLRNAPGGKGTILECHAALSTKQKEGGPCVSFASRFPRMSFLVVDSLFSSLFEHLFKLKLFLESSLPGDPPLPLLSPPLVGPAPSRAGEEEEAEGKGNSSLLAIQEVQKEVGKKMPTVHVEVVEVSRFLKAERGSVEAASESLCRSLQWRQQLNLKPFGKGVEPDSIKEERALGFAYFRGIDHQHRPLLIVRLVKAVPLFQKKEEKTSDISSRLLRFLADLIEKGVSRMAEGVESISVLVDMRGAEWKMFNVELLATVLRVLDENFPGRIWKVFFLEVCWRVRLFKEELRKKLPQRLLKKCEEADFQKLKGLAGPSQLPRFLGGQDEFEFSIEMDDSRSPSVR